MERLEAIADACRRYRDAVGVFPQNKAELVSFDPSFTKLFEEIRPNEVERVHICFDLLNDDQLVPFVWEPGCVQQYTEPYDVVFCGIDNRLVVLNNLELHYLPGDVAPCTRVPVAGSNLK